VRPVKLEADRDHVWLAVWGDGGEARQPLGAQVGDLLVGERHHGPPEVERAMTWHGADGRFVGMTVRDMNYRRGVP
jgi:hypothetical protein